MHDGTTPMFTYEMMLYYQGSSYTYMLRKAMAYAKVLEAQKNAVKARRVKEMRKKIKLAEEAEEKRLKDEEDRKNGIPGRKKSMLARLGSWRSTNKLTFKDEEDRKNGIPERKKSMLGRLGSWR